ncbi:carbon-nitrogen hydrolase family protein [Pueribacillus theae]|uniref:Carbon-nitrogen hydrolase family protein n=1 Tax=Pueribacillus theae TaxID=2171751 RepID=A0A2U1K152_9BACI|nr:carbon-nitrogen hydrolase family protein [Pueribacillus theae]PWA11227.1 carbon-nitrogen hydrolase family protein [Pueribacillus theae]
MDQSFIRVAAVQMDCLLGNKQKNLERAYALIKKAVRQGAQFIVVPELFNTAYRVEDDDVELAEAIPGTTTDWMVETAKEFNIVLVGCILEQGESRGIVYDTSLLVTHEGIKGKYRKTSLWDQEKVRFAIGDDFPVVDLGWGKVGMQICYEIGFPEGARILALKGADILVYPSAFGKARFYAWDLATRSRALENGCFLIASNRVGTEKGETTFAGRSRITNPKGEILSEAGEDNEVILADIDLKEVAKQRREIPYLRDLNKKLVFGHFN